MPKVNQHAETHTIAPLPWADWVNDTPYTADIVDTKVKVDGKNLVLETATQEIGRFTPESLRMFGVHLGYPSDFIEKLTPSLQANIINERISAQTPKPMTFIGHGGNLESMTPGWRDLLSHSEVAQTTWDIISSQWSDSEIIRAEANGKLNLRIMTQRQAEITPHQGDVLRFGVDVTHVPGRVLNSSLFAERLICENGMTANETAFSWSSRNLGTKENQLDWLRMGINEVMSSSEQVIERSRMMANTRVSGDIMNALRERAAAMRIPRRFWPQIQDAFQQEPGDTEWHLLNAITRFSTHSESPNSRQRSAISRLSGEWAREFDIVTARLPRPLAVRAGGEIIDTIAQ